MVRSGTFPRRSLCLQLHSSVVTALRNVLRREGMGGLYRGVAAMALGAGWVAAYKRQMDACQSYPVVFRQPLPEVLHLHMLCFSCAGPAMPCTLLPTRQPSSCMEATARGTTRWPPQPQVQKLAKC